MTITAKILLDSKGPNGARLTTFECMYPRFIHSEVMTHRTISRNAASSRAIPIEKMIERVLQDPALPVFWGKNQSGMQAAEELDDEAGFCGTNSRRFEAKSIWLEARDAAVAYVRRLQAIGLHKQIANRILEPWMHITTIMSATEWLNFFHLRTHRDAQPEFQALAKQMKELYDTNIPNELEAGKWHMPLVDDETDTEAWNLVLSEFGNHIGTQNGKRVNELLCKVSVGRCARVSYLTHDGVRDLTKDVELHDRLLESGHMSPFEHVAQVQHDIPTRSGNLIGFTQYRKLIQGEDDILGFRASQLQER